MDFKQIRINIETDNAKLENLQKQWGLLQHGKRANHIIETLEPTVEENKANLDRVTAEVSKLQPILKSQMSDLLQTDIGDLKAAATRMDKREKAEAVLRATKRYIIVFKGRYNVVDDEELKERNQKESV